jgi:hypothetical protein
LSLNSHLNTLSTLLYERTEISKRLSRSIGKDAFMATHRVDHRLVAEHCRPTPPPPWSSWWLAPPLPSPCIRTTAAAFGHSKPLGYWSGPHPLPWTDRLTGQWNPQTLTPLLCIISADRVPSTVQNHAPTGSHKRTRPHHRVNRGRRREKKNHGRLGYSTALSKVH